jgi:hypothetical protein
VRWFASGRRLDAWNYFFARFRRSEGKTWMLNRGLRVMVCRILQFALIIFHFSLAAPACGECEVQNEK